MKQLTRQEVEGVVEMLADKTLNFGCMLDDKNHSPSKIMFVEHGIGQTYSGIQIGVENTYNFFNGYMNPEMKVLGHPIYIGNVLEKMQNLVNTTGLYIKLNEFLRIWAYCGYSKSLQEIIEDSGWEYSHCAVNCPEPTCFDCVWILKSPEANALFSFLQEIL